MCHSLNELEQAIDDAQINEGDEISFTATIHGTTENFTGAFVGIFHDPDSEGIELDNGERLDFTVINLNSIKRLTTVS